MSKVTHRVFLDAFWETGSEGVHWSAVSPFVPGYGGLISLEDGDHLKVFNKNRTTVCWEGVISLEYERNWRPYPLGATDSKGNPYGQQAVDGMWVHGLQSDLAPEKWSRMFREGRPALVTLPPNRFRHPFLGKPEGMAARIRRKPEESAKHAFQDASYAILFKVSDTLRSELANNLGLSIEETVTMALSGVAHTLPGEPTYRLELPYSVDLFARIGLLWGIAGELLWKHRNPDARRRWLERENVVLENRRPMDLMATKGLGGLTKVYGLLQEEGQPKAKG